MKQEIVSQLLAHVEVAVEKAVEAKSDALVEMVLKEITVRIPGGLDDAAAEVIKPELKVKVKAFLLAQAEKISPEV